MLIHTRVSYRMFKLRGGGGGDNVLVLNKSYLGGSGVMLPQKIFEFKTSEAVI